MLKPNGCSYPSNVASYPSLVKCSAVLTDVTAIELSLPSISAQESLNYWNKRLLRMEENSIYFYSKRNIDVN